MQSFELPTYNPETERVRKTRETTAAALKAKCLKELKKLLGETSGITLTDEEPIVVYLNNGVAEKVVYRLQKDSGEFYDVTCQQSGDTIRIYHFDHRRIDGGFEVGYNFSSRKVDPLSYKDFVPPQPQSGWNRSMTHERRPVEPLISSGPIVNPQELRGQKTDVKTSADIIELSKRGPSWLDTLLSLFSTH